MDRNSIIGLLLIGAVLIGFSLWNAPGAEELAQKQKTQDSLIAVEQKAKLEAIAAAKVAKSAMPALTDTLSLNGIEQPSDSLRALQLQQQFGSFAAAAEGTEAFTTIENDKLKVTFTNKGGRVHAVELKEYKTSTQKPLILFESDSTVFWS
ncbi:MAG: YidC/Oxa1 family insertase periplasmic-domain containing protein [Bacteroidetes bacterium]|nr:YidC/Oxa1 family insertase periplasmic-domain containing protein [Bacteroidota bacterium]